MKRRVNWNGVTFITAIALAVICGLSVFFGVFEMFDYAITDISNRYLEVEKENNSPISIIAIDEATIAEYGEYETWSRQISADLINKLNEQEEKPVIIGIDLDYTEERDAIGDQAFVEACASENNVCLSVSQNGKGEKQQGNLSQENEKLSPKVRYPYDALTSVVQIGIRDNFVDNDAGAVREFATMIENEEIQMEGFAVVLYKRYQEHSGKEVEIDLGSTDNRQFNYIRGSQEYDMYSFVDVMNGRVDSTKFQNRIVLIGNVTEEAAHRDPFSISGKMQGIILQASMVDAMLSQKVIREFSPIALSMMYGCIIFLCNYVVSIAKKKRSLLVIGGVCYVHFHVWFYLKDSYYFPISALWAFSIMSIIVQLALVQIKERQEKLYIQKALETYVEPGIVKQILKNEDYEIQLGGKKKEIAVLFVDIRGFTTISESLEPEAVVTILNEYLELIARAVMNNKGTLDKFIGDAAMAIYNAPDDLPDYTLQAVKTARDIIKGATQIKEKSLEKYGVEIAFGVGIHCGTAIVGNIGCECRMDYTAIGDVVNTASRLEGKAKADQILVSREVYEQVKDMVEASFVGNLSLKGKKKEIEAYEINKIMERM